LCTRWSAIGAGRIKLASADSRGFCAITASGWAPSLAVAGPALTALEQVVL
jgi:hypothetical protein